MKARYIIPGWPRGRSTSRPLAAGSVWPWQYVHSPVTGEVIAIIERDELPGLKRWPRTIGMIVGGGDFCFKHNVSCLQKQCAECADSQAEERRKSDMMEVHWAEQRMLARGPLYPQPLSERMFGFYGFGFLIDPQILAQLEAVNEAANWICGGAPAAEAKERDGR